MTRIQIRRDTSSNWATYNPVLADGEFALETDTRKIKIGNGEQPYTELAYQGDSELPDNITTQGNTFNGANQLVQLDSAGKLPAIDGSQLTNIPAGSNSLNAISMDQNNFNNFIKAGTYYWSAYTTPVNHPNGNYKGMLQVFVIENGNSPVVQIFTLGEALDTSTPPGMWIRYCTSGRSLGYQWSSWLKVNGGDAPDNMVTTDTAQTITGRKTFDGGIVFLNNVGLTSKASTFEINLGDVLYPAQYCNITIRDGGLKIIDNDNTGNKLNFLTRGTYWRVSGDLRRRINGTDYPYITTADIGNLKYWTGTEAAYTAIETKDADTLYRTTDTNKVFLGTIQMGGNA